MDYNTLTDIISKIKHVRAGVIGDFCVDIYWRADMTKSELSKETPHFPLPVVSESFSPGAAGNVAANMAALSPAALKCIGLKGQDWRGDLLDRAMYAKNINSPLTAVSGRVTNAYCKPMRMGISDTVYEDPRIDFENHEPINREQEEIIMSVLENYSSSLDVIAVSDQFKYGIITPNIREKLIMMAEDGMKIIADSRYNISMFRNMFLKPNEAECAKAVKAGTIGEYEINAKELARRNNATVIETLGDKGSIITDGSYAKMIPAVALHGETDICGAGDTLLSALALSVGAGFNLLVCAEFASLASAVTVKKIGETGTASAEEIISLFSRSRE